LLDKEKGSFLTETACRRKQRRRAEAERRRRKRRRWWWWRAVPFILRVGAGSARLTKEK